MLAAYYLLVLLWCYFLKLSSCLPTPLTYLTYYSSIFTGDKLLTTANPEFDEDTKMFDQLGLKGA